MLEFVGWVSALCFLASGIPFALSAFKHKKANAPLSGILLILFGSFGMFIYEWSTAKSTQQMVDFGVTASCWFVVLVIWVLERTYWRNNK